MVLNYNEAIQFARDCYIYESKTRRAIDKGLMTIKELATHYYIYSLIDSDEQHRTLPKAFKAATEVFQISELEAKTLFERICNI